MHEALLYEKLPNAYVHCNICQWHCRIAPEKAGVCERYENRGGILYSLNYALVSSMAADPIEKKPLYHFHPGTQCFSLGSWGCNFHCSGCQNWTIACPDHQAVATHGQEVSPETAIRLAYDYKCRGIAWTYNEPTMWLEYSRDMARLAKNAGLYTAYVTNGYITQEALDTIGPYLQAWRVDIKGFGAETYKKLSKIADGHGIMEMASRAKNKWHMHIEVVTNLIPTINDDEDQLKSIANWIATELGELTPWHVTRFYPRHKMTDLPPTPLETMERARDIGHQSGLRFVYLGNTGAHQSSDTICYSCQSVIVHRDGFQAEILGLNDSGCKYCGADLNFRTWV